MSTENKRKKGYIPKSKFYPVLIENDATDDVLIECYNDIKKLIWKELRRKNDSTLRKGIDRRTSEKRLFS